MASPLLLALDSLHMRALLLVADYLSKHPGNGTGVGVKVETVAREYIQNEVERAFEDVAGGLKLGDLARVVAAGGDFCWRWIGKGNSRELRLVRVGATDGVM